MRGEGQASDEPLEKVAVTARFAATARALREARGLTQDAVSRGSGMGTAEVARLEQGDRDPQLWTIVRLARGLGVDPRELLEGLK
jgi:transcriptional regulator with XRE-family HTH domain